MSIPGRKFKKYVFDNIIFGSKVLIYEFVIPFNVAYVPTGI